MTTNTSVVQRLRETVDLVYRELAKFGVVGAVAFVVDIGTFNLLLRHVWSDRVAIGPLSTAVASTIISTIVSSLVAWLGNRLWTFRHRRNRRVHHEAALFFATNGVALVIGALCVVFSNKVLGLEGNVTAANIAKLVGIGLGTIFRFWAYRRFVFAGELASDPHLALPGATDSAAAADSPETEPSADHADTSETTDPTGTTESASR